MATKLQKLLFIDTNIWLDFYRARNETGLALLNHAESVASKIIVTYQLESEFKRN
ncbi:MAG: PIN-like domain-containing protein [Thiobacillus sp.]